MERLPGMWYTRIDIHGDLPQVTLVVLAYLISYQDVKPYR